MGGIVAGAALGAPGFVAANSGPASDVAVIVAIVVVAMLTAGVFLARSGRYGAHRWVQTVAVILSAVPVPRMIWSFIDNVASDLPGNLEESADALTTAHSVVGAIAIALGVFLVVRGNQLMARSEGLARYKTIMRVAYVAYLLAAALGVAVFIAIYD